MKVIDTLLKLNELKNTGHSEALVLASEKLEDSITFYKIVNFKYDESLDLCKMFFKFAFNTESQPEWIFNMKEYSKGAITIEKAYDILKELELSGRGDTNVGQEIYLGKSYNPIEDIVYEEKLQICSFNIGVNSSIDEELLSFL